MSNSYCVVFFLVLCTLLPVSLDWSFLIAPMVFSNIYFNVLSLVLKGTF